MLLAGGSATSPGTAPSQQPALWEGPGCLQPWGEERHCSPAGRVHGAMCWADTLTPLVQTLCTTVSGGNWPCFPRINTLVVGELGTVLGAEEHLSLLSPSFSHHQHLPGCRDAPTAAGSPRGTHTHRLAPGWGTHPWPPTADFPRHAAPSRPGTDTVLQPRPMALAVAPGLHWGSPTAPRPEEPWPGLPSPTKPQPQRNPSETEVSWNESLFICLIKMCSPGAQTPFHLSHLQPRPSKIKPNKYQTRESKGHM